MMKWNGILKGKILCCYSGCRGRRKKEQVNKKGEAVLPLEHPNSSRGLVGVTQCNPLRINIRNTRDPD